MQSDGTGEETLPEVERISELSVPEALRLALGAQKAGDFAMARAVFSRILLAVPEQPDALHFLGVLTWIEGARSEAIELVERAIAIAPEMADWRNNLGNMYLRTDREEEAKALYLGVIAEVPDHADAWANLGIAERLLRNEAAAEASFRRAIALRPDHADAQANLAAFLFAQRRIPEAMDPLFRSIALNPRHAQGSRILLARAHLALGEKDKAVAIFREWEEINAQDPVPKHYLAAITGENVPDRAPDSYVASVFDSFAGHFDSSLAKLDYRAPELIAGALDAALGGATGALVGLDAGCGTGLLGPLVVRHFRRLDGVDLSAKMLEKAQPRGVYRALRHGELTADLLAHPAAYDVVLSADTLCYFGGLEAVSAAAHAALRPGGFFLFSVERELAGDPKAGFRLQQHGRYCHREAYVRKCLEDAGFDVRDILRDTLRFEAGIPVAGLIVTASR